MSYSYFSYKKLQLLQVVSIGNTTARALNDAGVCASRICAKPTPEDLVEALNSVKEN